GSHGACVCPLPSPPPLRGGGNCSNPYCASYFLSPPQRCADDFLTSLVQCAGYFTLVQCAGYSTLVQCAGYFTAPPRSAGDLLIPPPQSGGGSGRGALVGPRGLERLCVGRLQQRCADRGKSGHQAAECGSELLRTAACNRSHSGIPHQLLGEHPRRESLRCLSLPRRPSAYVRALGRRQSRL